MSYTLTFGKYKGSSIDDVFKKDTKYVYWISQKSSNPIAVKAADAAIAKQRQQDDETDQRLVEALREINKQHSRLGLVPYRHVNIDVRDNVAEIDLCTHKLFTKFDAGVAINDEFHDSNWDAVKIVMDHEDLNPYDEEEDEDAWKRPVPLGPIPKAEDSIWYPIDAQHHLLSSQAMTLEQCINFLDEHLLKRQKPEEEKGFQLLSPAQRPRYSSKWYSKDEIEQIEEHDQAIKNEQEYWDSRFALEWRANSGQYIRVSLWCRGDDSYYFAIDVNGGDTAFKGKSYEYGFEDIKSYSNPEYPEMVARIGNAALTQKRYDALMAIWNRRSEWISPIV